MDICPSPSGNALDVIDTDFYNTLIDGNLDPFLEPASGQTTFFDY